MLFPHSLLLVSALISSTIAAPTIIRREDFLLKSPQLPSSSLPMPASLYSQPVLKKVTLGLGHQNYTCDATTGILTPVGATAALYDIELVLSRTPWTTNSLPGIALSFSGLHVSKAKDRSDDEEDYTRRPLLSATADIRQIGIHYFNADKQPTFLLPSAQLVAKRLGGISAPIDSCPGPDGAGAIDWLLLGDTEQGRSSGGLQYVYRVITAGGKAPKDCKGRAHGDVIRVPYAAEYWFYGSLEVPKAY